MKTTQHILIVLVLFGISSSCNISNEEDCGGEGGIQVNQELYNEITVALGETFSADLLGDPAVFTHPNNLSISVSVFSVTDRSIITVLIDPNVGGQTLFITGKAVGGSILTLRAEDECAGDLNPKVKEIVVTVTSN